MASQRMFFALNRENNYVSALILSSGVARSYDYKCVHCKEKVSFVEKLAKAQSHFRHRKNNSCFEKLTEVQLRQYKNYEKNIELAFHKNWQKIFPEDNELRSIICNNNDNN